jgi:glucose 1-dehydrogenase
MTGRVLDGSVAIVTGAGRGMGAATAKRFAAAGAKVLVSDIDEATAEETAAAIVAGGGTASFVRTDVSQAPEVEAMVRTAVERYGRLDCAVNNAAVPPDQTPITEVDEARFDRIIAVNLKGVALCMRYEIRQLLAQGEGGAIVNIGSVNSFRPQPGSSAYTAAKHAVLGLTKVASLDFAPLGIRVNAVCPGAVDTPMMAEALDEAGATEAQAAPALSLFRRFARPEEIAEASLWLCTTQASYVTGIALPVDAGYTSR